MAMQRRITVLVGLAAVAGAAVLTVELRGLGSVTPVPAKLTVLAVREGSRHARSSTSDAIPPRAMWHSPREPVRQSLRSPAS